MDVDEQDEELLGPPPREWPRLGRWRRPLIALVGVAVAGAAVVSLVRPGHGTRDASGTRSTSPSPSSLPLRSLGPVRMPQTDVLPAAPSAGPALPDPPLPLCPVGRLCEVVFSLPDAVYAALRTSVPDMRYVSARTLVSRRSPHLTVLVARVVTVRAGAEQYSIEVRRPQPGDTTTASLQDDRVHVAGLARARVPGYTVTIRALAPSGTRLRLDALQTLADDRRLVVRPPADRTESDDPGQR